MNLRDPLQNEKNPIFRKPIIIWYDSMVACLTTIFLLLPVFIFSLFGLKVAYENEVFREYIGLPISICILSFFVIVKILLRLRSRVKKDY